MRGYARCAGTSWRWVVAGFSPAIHASPLDDLLLELAGRERPHVVFLPTATGDSERADRGLRDAWGARDCTTDVADHLRDPGPPGRARRGRRRRRRGRRQHGEHARRLAPARRRRGPARRLGARRGARRRLGRRELLVRGVRDRLVLGRARRPRRRPRAPRRQLLPSLRRRGAPPAGLHAPRRGRLPGRDRVRRRSGGGLPRHRARRGRRRPPGRARLPRRRRPARSRSRPACSREEGLDVIASASGSGKTTLGRAARPTARRAVRRARRARPRAELDRDARRRAAPHARAGARRRRLGDRRRLPRARSATSCSSRPTSSSGSTSRCASGCRGSSGARCGGCAADEELWNGNRETLRGRDRGQGRADPVRAADALVSGAGRYPGRLARVPVVRLRTQAEVDAFLSAAGGP